MNNIEQKALSVITSTIKEAVETMVGKANFDVTVIGVITQIVGSTHFVKINGEVYQIKSSISGLSKGQKVRVNIPGNNWADMYIANTHSEHMINTNDIENFSTITNLEIDALFN